MSSNLRVNNILPSVGTNVAIGTAGGSVTLTGTTSGTFSGNLTGNVNSTGVTTVTTLSATNIVGVSTLGVTTAYINTLSGISTIDASSAVSINQNLVFASGKGIDFSATTDGSGTMTSELLNDYEVGGFTPFFAAGTVSGGYTNQNGTYVKIGRLVTFSLIIDGNGNLQGAAQGIQIGGLPFATQPGVAQLGGAYIVANQSFDTTNNRRFWYASGTVLVYTDASGNAVNGNAVNNVNSDLYLTGQYFTAS